MSEQQTTALWAPIHHHDGTVQHVRIPITVQAVTLADVWLA